MSKYFNNFYFRHAVFDELESICRDDSMSDSQKLEEFDSAVGEYFDTCGVDEFDPIVEVYQGIDRNNLDFDSIYHKLMSEKNFDIGLYYEHAE